MDLSIWTGYFVAFIIYAGFLREYGMPQKKPYWQENDKNRSSINK